MSYQKMVYQCILDEQNQRPSTRRQLYVKLQKKLKVPVISYFTSFRQPVMIEDSDADMLEGLLQKMNLSNGFALIISSPGGDGLAAERIINICRSYSGTDKYCVIVPGKAKSAATMICLGAEKILMSPTSELGPIDPQIVLYNEDRPSQVISVYNLIKSYKRVFDNAVNTQGRLEPYLLELKNYNAPEIEQCISELELSRDIAVKALKTGMLSGRSEDEIEKLIKTFLIPKTTKVHGRPIYHEESKQCGLNVELYDPKSDMWQDLYELYIRLNNYVNTKVSKCIETQIDSFSTPWVR